MRIFTNINNKKMKQVKGDLLTLFDAGQFDIIVHGCNCFHAMGAGIAGQIAKRYPQAPLMDRMNSEYGDIHKLSNYTIAHVGEGKQVVNLYSQFLPGKDLYEDALLLGFRKLSKTLSGYSRIGIPAIGCGIAGGDEGIIIPAIAEITRNLNITYVEYVPIGGSILDTGEEIKLT